MLKVNIKALSFDGKAQSPDATTYSLAFVQEYLPVWQRRKLQYDMQTKE